jgi:hypothetical protein
MLVKSMENDWGRMLYGATLVRNIGQVVYKVGFECYFSKGFIVVYVGVGCNAWSISSVVHLASGQGCH